MEERGLLVGIMGTILALGLATGFAVHTFKENDIATSPESPRETDERIFGFIRALEPRSDKDIYIAVDAAELLTGEEAQDAAREDGNCPDAPDGCLPTDYYVRNTETTAKWYSLDTGVYIKMQTYSQDSAGMNRLNEVLSLASFIHLFDASSERDRWTRTPFWITVREGSVTALEEQYVP